MPPTRVAIAGLGTIGRALARRLADGLPGLVLACAATRDQAKAQAWLEAQRIACPLVEPEDLPAPAAARARGAGQGAGGTDHCADRRAPGARRGHRRGGG